MARQKKNANYSPPVKKRKKKRVSNKKLQAWHLEDYELMQVIVKEETDEVVFNMSYSWTELILDFIYILYDRHRADFMVRLADYKILSDNINITNELVTNKNYDNTKIPETYYMIGTEYYIDIHDNSEAKLRAIYGLVKALKIKNIQYRMEELNT